MAMVTRIVTENQTSLECCSEMAMVDGMVNETENAPCVHSSWSLLVVAKAISTVNETRNECSCYGVTAMVSETLNEPLRYRGSLATMRAGCR